ncbi:hypothetical protein QE152_g8075 [Popillia japonica]|uniref:Uncharacterized protein n=1 Tax=Popillia japonica TaxID=7064 RepID=A0AAW1MDE5_POPJA
MEEVKEAISKLKNGKSAGHDGITAEMLKSVGDNGVKDQHKMQMTVNKDKTKVMILGKEEHSNIEIDGQLLEQVKAFKYLGVQIDSQGRGNLEVEARID